MRQVPHCHGDGKDLCRRQSRVILGDRSNHQVWGARVPRRLVMARKLP